MRPLIALIAHSFTLRLFFGPESRVFPEFLVSAVENRTSFLEISAYLQPESPLALNFYA